MQANLVIGLISLACATSAGSTALAQAPLWFTPKPQVVVATNATPAATPLRLQAPLPADRVHQPSASVQASPSDIIVEEAATPTLGLAVVERISDNDRPLADRRAETQAPLLNTESMIGPLQSAESLFSRLNVSDGLQGVASPARSGPRADAADYLWSPASYTWISPVFHHNPLYFEQPNLERYGIGRARVVQPLLSSVHFFGSIPLVPYKTLTHHPRERVYTLGQARPGNCVPLQRGVILGTSSVGEVSRFWHQGSGY